jgi:hypothetical protein
VGEKKRKREAARVEHDYNETGTTKGKKVWL